MAKTFEHDPATKRITFAGGTLADPVRMANMYAEDARAGIERTKKAGCKGCGKKK